MTEARVIPQGEGLAGLPFRYRVLAQLYRALVVAYFWDEEKFSHYAFKLCQQIEWGTLEKNQAARRSAA